jgi:hypothetical protein
VSMWSSLKSAMSRFGEAFWQGFYEARAQSGATARSAPSAAQIETVVAEVIKNAFDSGVRTERARMGEILTAPGVASYPLLAFELAIDGASVAQVSAVIARTEVAVQARIHPTESSPLESSPLTIH